MQCMAWCFNKPLAGLVARSCLWFTRPGSEFTCTVSGFSGPHSCDSAIPKGQQCCHRCSMPWASMTRWDQDPTKTLMMISMKFNLVFYDWIGQDFNKFNILLIYHQDLFVIFADEAMDLGVDIGTSNRVAKAWRLVLRELDTVSAQVSASGESCEETELSILVYDCFSMYNNVYYTCRL